MNQSFFVGTKIKSLLSYENFNCIKSQNSLHNFKIFQNSYPLQKQYKLYFNKLLIFTMAKPKLNVFLMYVKIRLFKFYSILVINNRTRFYV